MKKKLIKVSYQLEVMKIFKSIIEDHHLTGGDGYELPNFGEFILDPYCGICNNLIGLSYDLFQTEKYGKFEKYFKTWIYYSGDELFPIPAPFDKDKQLKHSEYYNESNSESLYKDKRNYDLRLSLVNHIIDELEKKKTEIIFGDC